MQTIAQDDALAKLASKTIDSYVKAQLPHDVHDRADCTQYGRRRKRMVGANAKPVGEALEPARTGIGSHDDWCSCMTTFVSDLESGKLRNDADMRAKVLTGIRARANNVAGELQMHWRHSLTCTKGRSVSCPCRTQLVYHDK
jgi:hypothetical protein